MTLEEFPFREQVAEGARNRTKLLMGYKGEARTIEPYSYRESPSGAGTLFYGFHQEAGHIKAFDLAKIESVEVTTEPFEPRWPVEI